jgi:hypothetical protein
MASERVNYINSILTLLAVLLGGIGAIWGANELFLRQEMIQEVNTTFESKNYATKEDIPILVTAAFNKAREEANKDKPASVSEIGANILGIPREQVAPRIGAMMLFAEEKMRQDEEFKDFFNSLINTKKLGLFVGVDGRIYFRAIDGDWLVRKQTVDGNTYHYYEDSHNIKHPLTCLNQVRVEHLN